MSKIKPLRELFAVLPPSGSVRHAFRNFNFGMSAGGSKLPSVVALASHLGLGVSLIDLPKHVRGRLVRDTFDESGYRIEINRNDSVETRRWTVLHEVMHFLIHPRQDIFASDQFRAGKNHFYLADELKEEREANALVASLLFSEGVLEAARSLYSDDVPSLARHFGVTEMTIKIALKKT
jgi:hypothetical protein